MTPQEKLDALFQMEAEMSGLATTATMTGARGRADALARLMVASEGALMLTRELLQFDETQLPFRHRFEELEAVQERRWKGLEEIAKRHEGGLPVGAMTTVSWLTDLTTDPMTSIMEGLKGMAAGDGVQKLVHWMTEGQGLRDGE